jgi:hypothetical protein
VNAATNHLKMTFGRYETSASTRGESGKIVAAALVLLHTDHGRTTT